MLLFMFTFVWLVFPTLSSFPNFPGGWACDLGMVQSVLPHLPGDLNVGLPRLGEGKAQPQEGKPQAGA